MEKPSSTIGTPPPAKPIYEALFGFIDRELPMFKPLSLDSKGFVVTAEDDITEDLSSYFDSKQEALSGIFKFVNQSKKSDIGVKLGRGYKAENRSNICWIEAKRLPTPNQSERDEREYVVIDKEKKGKGGIERFKENKHAPNLPCSIMIAYIQNETYDFWIKKINGWIMGLSSVDLFWNAEECLIPCCVKKESNRFVSIHQRRNKNGIIEPIEIHHFWINLE